MTAAPAYADILAGVPTETCRTCKATTGPCVSISGASKGKPLAGGAFHPVRLADAAWDLGYTSRDAEVKGLTDSLSLTAMQYKAAQGTIADLRAQVAELQEELNPPPVVVVERKHPAPASAVFVHPQAGADSNPGTEARPRKTFQGGAWNEALSADYSGVTFNTPPGVVTTINVPDGNTVVLDGHGTLKRAFVNSGVLNLYGNGRITNYAPGVANPSAGINCAPIYYGGTSAGSEIDGWTIENSTQAGLALQVPLKLTNLLVQDCGYAGILGTTADGMRFGDVRVIRPNRGGYNPNTDGQVAGIKMTRSANLKFGKGVRIEAANGANGLWTDVSCRNPVFAGCQVISNGAPAYIGLQVEETEGGTVAGCAIEGKYAGSLTASGHLAVWENTFTGSVLGLQVRQDRPKNTGKTPANLSPTLAPWWAVGNSICNNQLTGPVAFACYADAAYALDDSDMLEALRGNTFAGSVLMGDALGKRTTETPTQLAADLMDAYSADRQPVPAEVAALLA